MNFEEIKREMEDLMFASSMNATDRLRLEGEAMLEARFGANGLTPGDQQAMANAEVSRHATLTAAQMPRRENPVGPRFYGVTIGRSGMGPHVREIRVGRPQPR